MSERVEFTMPDVGEGIAEAEVLQWFVDVGDVVEADADLCEVETDKSVVEIPAPCSGILLAKGVPAGDIAVVGELLAVIGDAADTGADPTASSSILSAEIDEAVATGQPATEGPEAHGRRPLASPRTRRMAARQGIDLASVIGTGPHGRILESDLQTAPTAQDSTPATEPRSVSPAPAHRERGDEMIELRGLRRSIARSMTEALTIPHVTEFREVDATNLLAARSALQPSFEAQGLRLSVLPLLLKAVVRALERQPSMNATFDAATETLTRHAGVQLGMATATEDGLIVPVIRDADLLRLSDLTRQIDYLAERARSRTATPEELTGGSFTVTNFGSFGTWMGNPVIRPPEVGIAGFGRITEKVIVVGGEPAVRPVLPIVVATDHRINDGAHLAEFVAALAEAVAQPLLLLS